MVLEEECKLYFKWKHIRNIWLELSVKYIYLECHGNMLHRMSFEVLLSEMYLQKK